MLSLMRSYMHDTGDMLELPEPVELLEQFLLHYGQLRSADKKPLGTL